MRKDVHDRFHAGRMIFLIVLTLFLVSLPLFLFRPMKRQKTDMGSRGRFTFMTNTPSKSDDKYDLLYWERTGNPMLFAKADHVLGFSAFLRPGRMHFRPGENGAADLPVLGSLLPDIGFRSGLSPRLPSDLLPAPGIPVTTPGSAVSSPKRNAPLFFLEDGSLLPITADLPPAETAAGATVLRVTKGQAGMPPQVRIIRSSGNPRLDLAALRAVSRSAFSDSRVDGTIYAEWEQEAEK